MANDKNRGKKDRFEKELSRIMGKQLSMQRKRIAEILGAGLAEIAGIDWGTEGVIIIEALLPYLTKIAEDAFDDTVGDVGVALLNLEDAHDRLLKATGEYAFGLVKGINETTRQAITDAISDYYTTPGATIGSVVDALTPTFGPVRAEMIAVTEVTRAYEQGQSAAIDEYKLAGLEVDEYWQTNNDELVCPICGPLNETKRGDDWQDPPPAHPRCRCWKRIEVRGKAKAIRAYALSGVADDH